MLKVKGLDCSPIKNILVIGNGFDLEAKIKSSFEDFIRFITYGLVLYHGENFEDGSQKFQNSLIEFSNNPKCPEALRILHKLNKKNIDIRDKCYQLSLTCFGKLILSHIFPRIHHYFYSTPEKSTLFNDYLIFYGLWPHHDHIECYEEGDITIPYTKIAKGIETASWIIENELCNNSNIKLWLDVESVIEMIVTNSKELKEKYNFDEDTKFNYDTLHSYINGLEQFEILLTEYLKEAQEAITITQSVANNFFKTISDKHQKSLYQRSQHRVNSVDLTQANIVINYNYTNIAERMFKELGKHPLLVYINGSLKPEKKIQVDEVRTNIVIGYSNSYKKEVSKDTYQFEKSSRRIIKNTEFVDINALVSDEPFNLVILGHSCGTADSDVIGELLSHDRLNNATILCHTIDDLISIYSNIKSILDKKEKVFNKLMSYAEKEKFPSLYFSVALPPRNEESTSEQLIS